MIKAVILPAIAEALDWPGRPTVPERPATARPGRYGEFHVESDGDDLLLTYAQQPSVRLHRGDDARWRGRSVNVDAWFDGDSLVVEQYGTATRIEAT